MKKRSLISFDWAMKRLLRNKANFEVLEGFLSELLRCKIIIKNIGDSESNKEDVNDKYNRVDILVEANDKEIFIIELQNNSQDDYFHRMLYSASKTITEYMDSGDLYSKVRKVISINIVYFDLGTGQDYIYRGDTNFIGLHFNDDLVLTVNQQKIFGKTYPGELHPEYYIIKVNKFNDVAKDTLDEWIYYLKNSDIKEEFTAQGIIKARKVFEYDKLTKAEKEDYKRHIENWRIRESEIQTAFSDGEVIGLEKGEAIGLKKGLKKGKAELSRLKAEKEAVQQIAATQAARIAELERIISLNKH
jgi:predicted transposase/invertase (TIGR01784 family)